MCGDGPLEREPLDPLGRQPVPAPDRPPKCPIFPRFPVRTPTIAWLLTYSDRASTGSGSNADAPDRTTRPVAERALELVDSLELGDYRYVHSTRAELLRRLGRHEQARAAFEHALRLAATDPERGFLARRLAAP